VYTCTVKSLYLLGTNLYAFCLKIAISGIEMLMDTNNKYPASR